MDSSLGIEHPYIAGRHGMRFQVEVQEPARNLQAGGSCDDIGRSERGSRVDQGDFRAHGFLRAGIRGRTRDLGHELRTIIGEEAGTGSVDRRTRIYLEVRKLGAQPRVAAHVIQVPV
jgi:hypothetical protein